MKKRSLMTFISIVTIGCLNNQAAYCEDKIINTLPIMVMSKKSPKQTNTNSFDNTMATTMDYPSWKPEEVFELKKDISIDTIKALVTASKKSLCEVNKEGSYEIWLSGTLSGGVVISAAAESGIKAIINCTSK